MPSHGFVSIAPDPRASSSTWRRTRRISCRLLGERPAACFSAWAADAFDLARQHRRPGRLTRSGRHDRQRLNVSETRPADLAAQQQQHYADWFTDHADTLAYRDQLAVAVSERRHELGAAATATPPAHVVALIGSPPATGGSPRRHWTRLASRIEAYREEWGVDPGQPRQRPIDAVQQRAWDAAVRSTEALARPPAPSHTPKQTPA